MRRQKRLYIFGIVIVTLYLCSYLLFFILDTNGLFVRQWFTFAMLYLAIYLYYKAYIFKSDSSFYFANISTLSVVFMLITYFQNYSFLQIWPFFILISAIPYLINYFVFKNNYHIQMFLINIGLFLLASLFNFLLIL